MATPRKRITFQTPIRRKTPKIKKQGENTIKNKEKSKRAKGNVNEKIKTSKNVKDGQNNKLNDSFSFSSIEEEAPANTNFSSGLKRDDNINSNKNSKIDGTKSSVNNLKGSGRMQDNGELQGSPENLLNETEIDEYLKVLNRKYKTEKKLINLYKKENEMLRNLKKDCLAFKRFLGLEIHEIENNVHEFVWEIKDTQNTKIIKFRLIEDESDYSYELIENENVYLPEALEGCINFEKCQLMKFFLNMYEILLSKQN